MAGASLSLRGVGGRKEGRTALIKMLGEGLGFPLEYRRGCSVTLSPDSWLPPGPWP